MDGQTDISQYQENKIQIVIVVWVKTLLKEKQAKHLKKKWILWHVNYISVKVLFKINMCIDESDSKVRETS